MAENLTGTIVSVDDDSCCPLCGSYDVEYIGNDYDFGAVYYTNVCKACGSRYTLAYWVTNASIDEDKYNKEG